MFPDSEIAKKFTCGKTKLSYLITFGLAPYFSDELSDSLKSASNFVVLFDESFNRITKDEQLDVQVRFWDEDKNLTVTRYLGSQFLGHCTAKDLLNRLKEATKHLDTSKILQVSMDGPNVNHKFYRDYVADRKVAEPDSPDLLDLGSCGLHVIHGAFKTGATVTGWKIDSLLRSLWYLFSDSPARRADYTASTGSEIFPLQFCSTRWIEDVIVGERVVAIWKDVCAYVNALSAGPKAKVPNSASYSCVAKAVNDPLTLPKVHMFISVAKSLMPFLEAFQTDAPMVPFLSSELHKLLCEILDKIVTKKVLEEYSVSSSTITQLDFDDDSIFIATKHISVGFVIKEELKKANVSDAKLIEFKAQCKDFIKVTARKILARSPLKLKFVRNVDCINPKAIAKDKIQDLSLKFEGVLSKLTETRLVNANDCDELIKQYVICVYCKA
jgi:hypothetical protein